MKLDDHFYRNILDNLHDGVYYVDRERRITFWSKGAERITGFTGPEVLGRCCSDNILLHIDNQGLSLCRDHCPLSKTISDGQLREEEVYVHHKEGHRLPIIMRVAPIRDSEDRIIGAVETFSEISSDAGILQRLEDLQRMALSDSLTTLGNRRFIEMQIHSRLNELQRYDWPFGIIFIDVDHFKRINDTYGHLIGDKVLKMVSQTLLRNLRPFDVAGRWGGEEFISVIVNVNEKQLYSIASKLCFLVEQSSLTEGSEIIRVTISLGATLAHPADTVDTLISRADLCMYQSKHAGRNRVSMHVSP